MSHELTQKYKGQIYTTVGKEIKAVDKSLLEDVWIITFVDNSKILSPTDNLDDKVKFAKTDLELFLQFAKQSRLAITGISNYSTSDNRVVKVLELQNWAAPTYQEVGYRDFLSTWHFDADGKLVQLGHWE